MNLNGHVLLKPKGGGFVPSNYQQSALDWVESSVGQGKAAVMNAVAGSGKSRTLRLIYETASDKFKNILVVCFGKDAALDAKEKNDTNLRIPNVEFKTYHSYMFSAIKKKYNPKLVFKGEKIDMIVGPKLAANHKFLLSPIKKLVGLCKGLAIRDPSDEALTQTAITYDVEFGDNVSPDLVLKSYDLVRYVLDKSIEMVETVIDFDDMIYLPIMLDLKPDQYDAILADEFQDTNRSQALGIQMGRSDMMMGVGDPWQCIIDTTEILCYTKADLEQHPVRGVKSMSACDINVGDVLLSGYGNGRIGEGKVLRKYEKWVNNQTVVTVSTLSGKKLTTTPEHMYFSSFEVQNTKEIHYVYLMEKEGKFRVGKAGGYRSFGSGITPGFRGRGNQEGAEKLWVLKVCDSDSEARYWEAYFSFQYGLPLWLFRVSGRGYSLSYNDADIERLFSSIDTKERALRLLIDLGMFYDYPHYVPKCMSLKKRRNFNISLCGEAKRDWLPSHRFSISGSDDDDRGLMKSMGLSVRNSKGKGWRVESVRANLGDIYDIYKKISNILPTNLIESANLSIGDTLEFMPAGNLHTNMSVFIYDQKSGTIIKDIITKVERKQYDGFVYDFDIDRTHNFVANGIVTHNSIYAFRGADSHAMQNLIEQFNAHTLPLSLCYRCPQAVGDLIRREFPHIDFQTPEWAVPGRVDDMDTLKALDVMQEGDLVVSRVNAALPPIAFALIRKGKTARIMGRDFGKSLETLIIKQHADDLPDLFHKLNEFRSKQMAKFAAANRPDKIQEIDDKIETIFALSEGAHTVWDLLGVCAAMFTDDRIGIQLGTVHKNKGREADHVFIARPDLLPLPFVVKKGSAEAKQQEENMRYVAYSRPKESLTFLHGEL